MPSSGGNSQEESNGPGIIRCHHRNTTHIIIGTMAKRKLETFTSTSEEDYDRHKYKLVLKNGKAIVLEDYEQARAFWNQFRTQLDHVEVMDR